MTNVFEIEKPTSDTNYFTMGIKYVVLFIVLFLGSWIAIPILLSKRRGGRINPITEFLAENAAIFSVLISLAIIAWFIYRIKRKYAYGEVFKINFNDPAQKLNIYTVNTMNNVLKENSYDYVALSFKFYKEDSPLFGKQRVLHILKNEKTVHAINFDRTAWCRYDELENLIEKIKTEHSN